MTIREKNATVSFFQLHTFSKDGSHIREDSRNGKTSKSIDSLPAAGVDWQTRLKDIAEPVDAAVTTTPKAIQRNGKTVDGQVRKTAGKYAISLSVDRTIPPRERNLQTGERKGMAGSGQDWDPAEETVVTFYERNIFGLLSSNMGAPSHTDVARWLSQFSPPYSDSQARWSARPITRTDVLDKLIKKKGFTINAAEFKLRPNQMDKDDLSIFGLMPSDLNKNRGMEVSIKFRAGRTKQKSQNAEEIADFVDEVVRTPIFTDENKVTGAKVAAKSAEGEVQTYDLFSDRITHRATVRWDDRNNSSDFMQSAVKTIDSVYSELRSILHERVPDVPKS